MTWLTEHIIEILGIPTGGFIGWFLGRKKENAQVASIEVQTLRSTITSLQEVNAILRENINELQQDIHNIKSEFDKKCNSMQTEIDELRKRLK